MDLTNNATEFRADSHFNIHIEGAGSVSLYRRTSGTGWSIFKTFSGSVIDEDVAVNIPKDWKVVFSDRPSMAVVTLSTGEVIELEIPSEPSVPEEPSVNLITFTVEGYDQTFTAEEGMNWMEFCASEYNTEGWDCGNGGSWVWLYNEGSGWSIKSYYLEDLSSDHMPIGEDSVKNAHHYTFFEESGIGGGGPEW